MQISEIFHSIQGEGLWTGIPAVFIRMAGCNLRCHECDTPYALAEDAGRQMSMEEVLDAVGKYPARHCVITGGEPMIAPDVRQLAEWLNREGYRISLETNATRPPRGIICDLVSLSPKLPGTALFVSPEAEGMNPSDERIWCPEVIHEWIDGYPYQLKFVVSARMDVQAVRKLIAELDRSVPAEQILLMPRTRHGNYVVQPADVVEWCKEYGYRYCNRLHIELYGERRGV